MSSAICFNLEQPRILSSGDGLNVMGGFWVSKTCFQKAIHMFCNWKIKFTVQVVACSAYDRHILTHTSSN